jgi:3-phosphoshikimate 1-carboxyvinyltransferase
MNKTIKKSEISGELVAPTSKSALQRIIVAAMLARGKSIIHYESMCEDALAIAEVAKKLGAKVNLSEKKIEIDGGLRSPEEKISVGESGLGLRMLSPILAATGFPFEISGRGSLLNRPVEFVADALRLAGTKAECTNGNLPLKIQGPVSASRILIDGNHGSQLLTGFLMAAPLLDRVVEINVSNLKSKPYIDLTINILKDFGIDIQQTNYEVFSIKKGQNYRPINTTAEGDWSGAAFPLVAAAIAGKICIKGLNPESAQGDKAVLDALYKCGAIVQISDEFITIENNDLKAFDFDATDTPDLFPPLVALAVSCNGKSTIKGVSRLKHKESDRGMSLQQEFAKMGAQIRLEGDVMKIDGCRLEGTKVFSHHDHRIAMALAVAGMNATGETIIENAEAVGKSWPEFYDQFEALGAIIE